MPECPSIRSSQCKKVSVSIAGKSQPRICRQDSRTRSSRTHFVTPPNLPCLVIDSFDHALAPQIVIRSSPSIITVCGLVEIKTPTRMSTHDEQASMRIEARRPKVRQATFIRRNQAAIRCRLFLGIGNRLPSLIDAERPVHRPERCG